jgi:hypothetical protein
LVTGVEPGADLAAVEDRGSDDESMRIGHEVIHQPLFIEGRGAPCSPTLKFEEPSKPNKAH